MVSQVSSLWFGTGAASLSSFATFFHSSYRRIQGQRRLQFTKGYAESLAWNALPWVATGVFVFAVGVLCLCVRSCCCQVWWHKRGLRPGTGRRFLALALTGVLLISVVYAGLAVSFQAAANVNGTLGTSLQAAVHMGHNLTDISKVLDDSLTSISNDVTQYVNSNPSRIGEECKAGLQQAASVASQIDEGVQQVVDSVLRNRNTGKNIIYYIFLAMLILLAVQVVITFVSLLFCQGYLQNCCLQTMRVLALLGAALVMGLSWALVGLAVAAALGISDACASQNTLHAFLQAQAAANVNGSATPTPPPDNAFYQLGIQCPTVSSPIPGESLPQALRTLLQECSSVIQSATGLSNAQYSYVRDTLEGIGDSLAGCVPLLQLSRRFGGLLCGTQQSSGAVAAGIIFIVQLVLAVAYIVIFFMLVFDADLLLWTKLAPLLVQEPPSAAADDATMVTAAAPTDGDKTDGNGTGPPPPLLALPPPSTAPSSSYPEEYMWRLPPTNPYTGDMHAYPPPRYDDDGIGAGGEPGVAPSYRSMSDAAPTRPPSVRHRSGAPSAPPPEW
ncbi:hypothetical protein CDCA_CDCA09G2808 [Cyanidium caldarium]|uniref:Protein tweety homolog n=1 Tax=Cyanidium caldarium TaxID=2771 RepID=A0AAV9IXF8_CYACA|nr:hypothetical protein CDCA_CDCA09G2808 [Cyanidium caldarium]